MSSFFFLWYLENLGFMGSYLSLALEGVKPGIRGCVGAIELFPLLRKYHS